APALSRGMLFVPWATQNVSVIDVETRDELARVRITDTMVGRAFVLGGSVYVGQRGLFRFDEAIASGNREGASYFEHDRAGGELPGDPPLFIDPYSAPPPAAGGSHRVRLHWHPATGSGDVHPAGGLVYHVFYRIVFALDAADGRVRWAYSHPATIVGSAASGEGLLLVDQEGGVFRLGEDGAEPEPLGLMDLQPTVAVIREGLDSRSSAAGPVDPVDPAQSLLAAIRLSDARLAPARAFAARRLAAMPDEAITPLLIELCADPRLTQTVRDGACEGLGRRSSGASSVLSALSQHASFMEARPAPPAGPLAQAAARMGADAAIPAILAHLRDPATPERDLPALVRALGSLAAEDANEPLLAFLRLYHADAQSDAMVATLTAIAETVLESGDANARDALREIAAAPLGVAVVGERINQAIAAQEQAEARAADAGRPPAPEEESSEGGDATPRRR
ncbi:MAG: hypothetical protein OEY14_09295, partial [Myxococcales bacterium]|nr:hypothetical protein [Myxococcales bacterium]